MEQNVTHRDSELAIINALGREFERAAARSSSRVAPWRWGRRSLAVAMAAVTLSVAAAGAATGFLPVGSVITDGDEFLPEEGDHVVVATGQSAVLGPWQLEAYTSGRLTDPESGTVYQSSGHPCLDIRLTDPREGAPDWGGGFCGEFPKTPGFSRGELPAATSDGRAHELLLFGRAPQEAQAIRLTGAGGFERRVEPLEGPPSSPGKYWVITAPPSLEGGRVAWLDSDGHVGGTIDVLYSPSQR
jgi:hypothetical protein